MLSAPSLVALCAVAATAQATHLRKMENLITFGDSYTDESRLTYFIDHGHGPPAGELTPASNKTFSGGYAWGRVVANMTGAQYYDYAVAGAMCADNITSHWFDPIKATQPSMLDYEMPAFEADLAFHKLYPNRHPDNTVYAVWIGTNDLGYAGFLTDRNVKGTSLPTFVDCVWETFDRIYKTGGRHFVLLNQVPLENSPMYTRLDAGGTPDCQYWQNKTLYNTTEAQYKIFEYATTVNALFDQGMPYHLVIKKRWPGARFTIFDVHSLFNDIRDAPDQYFTSPANVTGPYRYCTPKGECVESTQPKSSFLW